MLPTGVPRSVASSRSLVSALVSAITVAAASTSLPTCSSLAATFTGSPMTV